MNIPVENSIFEISPNPIIIITKIGILLKSNKHSENIIKYWNIEPGESIPEKYKPIFLNDTRKRKRDIELITENYIYSFKIIAEENAYILFGQDITSSFLINRKLQEIEERYRLLANNSQDIISRHNLEGIFLYVSPSCEPYLKKDPSLLLGKSIFSFVHKEDIGTVEKAFKEIRNTNDSITITFRVLTSDNQIVWLESVLKKVKSSYQSFYEVISVARDISERKNMEAALKSSEELYKSVADNLSEGLITLDLKGQVQFVNKAMEKISEMPGEQMIGKHIWEITSSRYSEFIQNKLEERKAGIKETYELFIETNSLEGEGKWIEINSAPYKDIDGNIIGALASLTDITLKKKQEEEIAKLSLVASKTDNGVVITNSKGLIEWVNESFTKISGYSLDEIKGKKPGTLLQGEGTDPMAVKTIRDQLAKKRSFETLLLNYNKEGKPYWVQIEITPVQDSSGCIVSYFSVQKDVTEKIQTLELLKESEQRYKDLLSASFEGIVVHKDGIVLDCNSRFAEMLGYPFAPIIGSPIQKYIPESISTNQFSVDETLDKSTEHIAICCDGIKLQVEIITRKHVYKNSIVKVTVIKDIGERNKTLKKLRESESKYRDLVETASSFIYTSDCKGNFQYVNSVGIQKMGYTQEEFQTMNFTDPVVPSWKARVENFYNNQFHNKIRESYFEFPVYTKHNEILWLGQNVQMIEENGWITGFNCYARDITERKAIEHELDSQKDLLKIILDTLPIGIFLKNNLGECLFINNEASKNYGNNISLFENENKENSKNTALKHENDHFILEEKMVLNSGEKYFLIGRKKIHSDYFNNPLALGYYIDITDRKLAEEALILAKQKAEESTQAKERFISIMSHEIRTPMNAVVGITNLLIQQSHSEEQKEYLHALKTSSDNLLKILNNILDLSKLESGKISFENIAFDIREILSEIQETFKFKAAEKNIEIINTVSSDIPRLLNGDPLRLHQILVNLVSNALKFTLEGKITIKIEVLSKDEPRLHLQFSVSDTGIGIPQEKFLDIFESFTQVSTEVTRKFGGTGLGLTITKRLVELQGGSIQVQSTIDKGSTFLFDLWLESSSVAVEHNDWDLQYDLKGIKLLLVEDNEMNRLVVKKYLEKEQIEITLAEDGKKAIELFEKNCFDIILMDLQMPVMDGYEATKYIRSKNSQIPVIAFTASSSSDIELKVKGVGMTDIITKPFQPSRLCGLIAKYTSKEQLRKNRLNEITLKSLNPIIPMDYKFINLTYLREASNGNIPFIQNMIEIFLKQTPGYLEELQTTLEQKDWEKFRKTIHKMKPTIPMMGIPLQKEVAQIEESAKQQTNLENVPLLLDKLVAACKGSYKELQQELDKIKKRE